MITCSSSASHNNTCRRTDYAIANAHTMQVTENARPPFFTVRSDVRSIFPSCRERAPCIRALTANLLDTINWRQVASKWKSVPRTSECVDAKHPVRVTWSTHAAPRANDCRGLSSRYVLARAVCVRVCGLQLVVPSLSIHKSWFLLTPFARRGSHSHYFWPLFCAQNKLVKNAQRQRLAAKSQTMTTLPQHPDTLIAYAPANIGHFEFSSIPFHVVALNFIAEAPPIIMYRSNDKR